MAPGPFPAAALSEAPGIAPPSDRAPAAAGRKRPLRKLSPEEKAQRRLRRNIIVAATGVALLLIVMSLLLKLSG
jgi:hypothetical protein